MEVMEVTLKPDPQKLWRPDPLMGNYCPRKFLGLLAPTQYRETPDSLPLFVWQSGSARLLHHSGPADQFSTSVETLFRRCHLDVQGLLSQQFQSSEPRCLREEDNGEISCSGACVGEPSPDPAFSLTFRLLSVTTLRHGWADVHARPTHI